MKRILTTLLAALMTIPAALAYGADQVPDEGIQPIQQVQAGDLGINVWVDNSDGVYYDGENITVSFNTTQDCYVVIYSVDTRGEVNILFPPDASENGYVQGGQDYAIPGRYDNYELAVSGPEGIEYIQAIASKDRLDIPDWYGSAPIKADYGDDREDFIRYINDRYFGCRWNDCVQALDRATIYIKTPRYYYKPVYVPQTWYTCPDYGMVYIDYPYGAEIYIDGIYFGIAPLWIPRVIVGYHWFTIYDRYGYCWEDRIDLHHLEDIRLDRSRVKTSRTVVSRYGNNNIRVQAKKFDRASYVKSDERVKSTRDPLGASRGGLYGGRGFKADERNSITTQKTTRSSQGARYTPDYNRGDKRTGYDRSGATSKSGNSSPTYTPSGKSKGTTRGTYQPTPQKGSGSTGNAGGKKSSGSYRGSVPKSSGSAPAPKQSSGSSSKGGGSKSSGGGKRR